MPLTTLLSGIPLEAFDRILDAIPEGILLIGDAGRVVHANAAMEAMLGYGPGQVVGLRTVDLVVAEEVEESNRTVASLLDGEEGISERGLRHADGRRIEVELKARRLAGGLVCSVVRDVTELRRRDEALRESEERFRSAAQSSAIGMALVALDGRWLSVNPAMSRMLGYSPDELRTKTFQEITHPDDLALDVAKVGQMVAGQLHSYQIEKRYIKRDGSIVWGRLTVSLVHDARGAPLYFVSQVQDITEQRALAERAVHAEKMEAIGRLAAGIAHDFNNVLAAMRSNAELIQMLSTEALAKTQAATIVADADRAAAITRQLQLFSRRHVSNPREVALDNVIREAAPLIERLITRRALLTLDLDSVVVRADPQQIQQILLNLCVNARDAMPDAGTIAITLRSEHFDASLHHQRGLVPAGRYAVLSVTDTGTGITDDVMAKLFEPFFTTKGNAGNGIGLATVDAIVEHHNGEIVVRTELGVGTTFTIYLPLATTEPTVSAWDEDVDSEASRLSGKSAVSQAGRTILIVDDDRSLREAASRVLEAHGFRVATAASAEDALALLEHLQPNAFPAGIITDITMPGMNGRELGDVIAQRWPDVPVSYMSGYSDDALLQGGILEATRRFIAKPFAAETLVNVANEMVARTERRAQISKL